MDCPLCIHIPSPYQYHEVALVRISMWPFKASGHITIIRFRNSMVKTIVRIRPGAHWRPSGVGRRRLGNDDISQHMYLSWSNTDI